MTIILVLVSVLVAVSTALVGPVMFFGLLVAALAHYLTGNGKHAYVLPAAILIAIICLVGGQVVLERIFAFNARRCNTSAGSRPASADRQQGDTSGTDRKGAARRPLRRQH